MEIKNLKLGGRASPPPSKVVSSAMNVATEQKLSFGLGNDRRMSYSSISPKDKVQRSSLSLTSRYSHSSYKDSVNLKVLPNCEQSPRDHFKTVQFIANELQTSLNKSLHVPSRREHFNSRTSVKLGSNSSIAPPKTSVPNITAVTNRFENTPKDTLNVYDVSKSKCFEDVEP